MKEVKFNENIPDLIEQLEEKLEFVCLLNHCLLNEGCLQDSCIADWFNSPKRIL
ncbi:hypothetical protein G4W71_05090 [Clostridium botulinum]|uniref:hypothetical protein n=1 Tax=Clostridium botulinum TaxID=1491 RepID=UPI001788BFCE|nr:hypothetical protein [Clostridium botulinum]MBE1303413.1 hypothetical protein [Clostridium botulinum]